MQTVWTSVDVTGKISSALSGLADTSTSSTDLGLLGKVTTIVVWSGVTLDSTTAPPPTFRVRSVTCGDEASASTKVRI